jgi:sugar-specific transcriptional regulator TrmB
MTGYAVAKETLVPQPKVYETLAGSSSAAQSCR